MPLRSDFYRQNGGIELRERDEASKSLVQSTERRLDVSRGNGTKKGWKPVTMHPIILLMTVVVCISFIIILQVLITTSQANDGLAFAPVDGDFSAGASFSLRYLPTIVSVSLSIFWGWVDLDHKRMEPFLQMSKVGGASAENSMLLCYPFEFVAEAPFKALRRGHWAVALSGTIMLLITLAITPLQGAIFVSETVNRTISIQATQSTSFAALPLRAPTLDGMFLEDVWNMIWFNESIPPFTNMEGTVLPFKAEDAQQHRLSQATISANRTFFYSSLNCTRATQSESHDWDAGSGCAINYDLRESLSGRGADAYYLQYFGWGDIGSPALSLSSQSTLGSGCHSQFFGYWLDNLTESTLHDKEGGFFCSPSYWAEEALVMLAYPNYSVISITPSGNASRIDDQFNASTFQRIIDIGQNYVGGADKFYSLSAPDQNPISEDGRLRTAKKQFEQIMPRELTPMVGMGIGLMLGQNYSVLMDYDNFTAAMSRVNSMAFAIAGSQILNESLGMSMEIDASLAGLSQALVVSEAQTNIVQALFALVSAMCLTMIVANSRRPSNLVSNPDSLAAIASLTPPDGHLQDLSQDGNKNTAAHYYLHRHMNGACVQRLLLPDSVSRPQKHDSLRVSTVGSVPWRPFYLGGIIGVSFTAALLIIFFAIIVLQVTANRNNGLPPPYANKFWQGIILNYLPTVFATLIEPFWILLSHTLCLLQPFEELRKNDASPQKSAQARYLSLPPQLAFFRALSKGHLLLATLCVISLSSNILAISLAAMFDRRQVPFNVTVSASQALGTTFSTNTTLGSITGFTGYEDSTGPLTHLTGASVYEDHFYVAQMNLSGHGPLPLWMTPKGYFVPVLFNTPLSDSKIDATYLHTYGFTYEPVCNELKRPAFGTDFAINVTLGYDEIEAAMNVTLPNITGLPDCTAGLWKPLDQSIRKPEGNESKGLNLVIEMDAHDRNCSSMYLGVFIRSPNLPLVSEGMPEISIDGFREESGSYFYCGVSLKAAEYDIQLNQQGDIVSAYNTTVPESLDPGKYFHGDGSALQKLIQTSVGLDTSDAGMDVFSNATASLQWLPYLMALSDTNMDTIDPTKPAPEAEHVMDLASRTIALLGALKLSQNRDSIFDKLPDSASGQLTIQQSVSRPRVFLNPVMLPLALILLGTHAVIAVVFYVLAPKKLLPVLPTTLGRQLGLFAGSSLLQRSSGQESGHDRLGRKSGPLWDNSIRLGYGYFRGTDGVLRTGIERAQFVTPIPSVRMEGLNAGVKDNEPRQESYGEEKVKRMAAPVRLMGGLRTLFSSRYQKVASE